MLIGVCVYVHVCVCVYIYICLLNFFAASLYRMLPLERRFLCLQIKQIFFSYLLYLSALSSTVVVNFNLHKNTVFKLDYDILYHIKTSRHMV